MITIMFSNLYLKWLWNSIHGLKWFPKSKHNLSRQTIFWFGCYCIPKMNMQFKLSSKLKYCKILTYFTIRIPFLLRHFWNIVLCCECKWLCTLHFLQEYISCLAEQIEYYLVQTNDEKIIVIITVNSSMLLLQSHVCT